MKLSELAKILNCVAALPEKQDFEIVSFTADSRQVKPGFIFFALPGSLKDGLEFVEEAVLNGAVAIVSSQALLDLKIPNLVVSDVRFAYSAFASVFYNNPSRDLFALGVTGTNGKTTITYLLEALWKNLKTGVIGTVNTRYLDKEIPATHTTPDALSLHQILAEMKAHQVTHLAMEVSSHALDQKRADHVEFDAAIFTNLTQDHLDYHPDMESYFQAKARLFQDLLEKSPKKNKFAVISLDDDYGKKLAEMCVGKFDVVTCSVDPNSQADLKVLSVEYNLKSSKAKVQIFNKEFEIETSLVGEFNLKNILAVLAVAYQMQIEIPLALKNLESAFVPGRLERIEKLPVFVDYAHTPDALKNVLQTLRKVSEKSRLIVVFGCGGDRDKKKRPLMGEEAARLADVVFVTSDNPRTENPDLILQDIVVGLQKKLKAFDGEHGFVVELDRKTAIEKAVQMRRESDVLLVAGKGHENYQIFGTQKLPFDDCLVLRDALAKRGEL